MTHQITADLDRIYTPVNIPETAHERRINRILYGHDHSVTRMAETVDRLHSTIFWLLGFSILVVALAAGAIESIKADAHAVHNARMQADELVTIK